MPGAITRLAYQKRHRQRVNVYLDGEYAFSLPDTEAAHLKVGEQISSEQETRLRRLSEESKAFDKALRILGRRPRSSVEVSNHLQRAGFSANTSDSVLARLQQLGYVDDQAFTAWWIENRSRFNPRGAQALRYELRQKGIDSRLIDQALAGQDETAAALAAGQARLERWRHLPHETFHLKMLGFLQRRGFTYETSRHASDRLWQLANSESGDEEP